MCYTKNTVLDYIKYISLSVFYDCFKMFIDENHRKYKNSLNSSNYLVCIPFYLIKSRLYLANTIL